jgi:hypothetical protein
MTYHSKKGINSINTLQTVIKSAARQKDSADFLDLYMLEKEKNRLMNEQSRILNRLDHIQSRLNSIQHVYEYNARLLHRQNGTHNNLYRDEKSSNGFTTIQIEY